VSKFIKAGLLAAGLLLAQQLCALTDPTRPSSYRPASVSHTSFTLSSVIVSDSRKVAIINGKVLAEGEKVAGAKVKRIEKQQVLLSHNGKTIKLVPPRTTVRREK
jgi:MSHA biogenesis protein MshK